MIRSIIPSICGLAPLRLYSTGLPPRPPIKLIAELRKLTDVPITRARDALVASDNDLDKALLWLENELVIAGAQKAGALARRDAREGIIALSILRSGCGSKAGNVEAAMVELNCETDFVAKSEMFGRLASDIAHTAAASYAYSRPDSEAILRHYSPLELDSLNRTRLESAEPSAKPSRAGKMTVEDSILTLIAKVGEKVSLRRAVVAVVPLAPQLVNDVGFRVFAYAHGPNNSQGQKAVIATLRLRSAHLPRLLQSHDFMENLQRLERALARQVVGCQTKAVRASPGAKYYPGLYDTPFTMLNCEETVETALRKWSRENGLIEPGDDEAGRGVLVEELAQWTVGEPLDVATASP